MTEGEWTNAPQLSSQGAARNFKTALGEQRLPGHGEAGNIRLNCQDSETGRWHALTLGVDEFLRRWCLHVLPKGLVRVRHYGFLRAC